MKRVFLILMMVVLLLVPCIAHADTVDPQTEIQRSVELVLGTFFQLAFFANLILDLPLILVAIFVKKKPIKIIAIVLVAILLLLLLSTFIGGAIWSSLEM